MAIKETLKAKISKLENTHEKKLRMKELLIDSYKCCLSGLTFSFRVLSEISMTHTEVFDWF